MLFKYKNTIVMHVTMWMSFSNVKFKIMPTIRIDRIVISNRSQCTTKNKEIFN